MRRFSRRTTKADRYSLKLKAVTYPTPAKNVSLKVWACVFFYALVTGLLIQFVVLPYAFPQLHAGNGLLAGRDWVGFHEQAVVQAQKIAERGWGEFLLRPDGDNSVIGLASFFYVVFGPHPYTLLPLNAALFASGGLALFSILKQLQLKDDEALIALLPYLIFPSALLQYGQMHKDVFCTAGLLVVLWSWISLLNQRCRLWQIIPLLAISGVAVVVVSVFRPYFMLVLLGLAVFLCVCYLMRTLWSLVVRSTRVTGTSHAGVLNRNLQPTIILALLTGFLYVMSVTYLDVRLKPFPADAPQSKLAIPVLNWYSNATVRSADASRILKLHDEEALAKAIRECRPVVILRDDAVIENTINRIFLKIAVARAGFTSSGGTTAASNIDKGIDFCKNEDLIRYIPRALQIAFFAPFPSNWFSMEKRNSSAIEIYISAVEMFYCYIAYFGLLYWLFSYRRWSVSLAVPIAFAVGMSLLLGLTVANVGTLYRMRFPFAMIFVSIGMAGILQIAKMRPPWVENSDVARD